MTARWNWDIGVKCCACGGSLWEDLERAFCFAPHAYVCEDCSVRRGGAYDPASETWIIPPDVRDSGVERFLHAERRAART